MEMKLLFSTALFLCCSLWVVDGAMFIVRNNCPYTIWPATQTSGGPPITTGFQIEPTQSRGIEVPPNWSGRMWARFQCSNSGGSFSCRSGDCASGQIECSGKGGIPPATLAEFTLGGFGGNDFFDVSLVDGFNLPITISRTDASCASTSCPVDVNAVCPDELSIRDPAGGVIGCKSACLAFGKPEFCCAPPFNTPESCSSSTYSRYFKQLCPQAYSYAYDDRSSTFTCRTGGDYVITFCP